MNQSSEGADSVRRIVPAARPTLKDVARVAGVGAGTVSRVLNHQNRVSADTRARVLAAIAQLEYRPDASAGALRRGTSGSIGLLVEDVADPFYSQLNATIEEALIPLDLTLLTASSARSPERAMRALQGLVSRRVDALIVTFPEDADETFLKREGAAGTAVVFVDRPPRSLDADSVLTNNRGGAKRAVEHLIARGHSRIALVNDRQGLYTADERRAGWQQAHATAGLPSDLRLVMSGSPDDRFIEDALRSMLALSDPPTAVFSGNNRIAVGVLRALRALGVRLDHVGFDDLELSDLLDPPLTVVAQDPYAMGRAAVERVVSRMAGDEGPATTLVLEPQLVIRS
ncbi:LacI family DNA-binding transcriptional regulator [Microbacterium sp.]|uniref:LacI family DNA-binding transcriptional regulator n=1 Tax=Microbacterium sp. TaxID=51671 RepID=UPI0026032F9A|nr:LacI family DNA-binding transcriptional regulator [Microbacterium sp.]